MEKGIGGTLVWYYCLCPRQVWLMAHNILPDEDDDRVSAGRLIHQFSYPEMPRREVNIDNTITIDLLPEEGVVAEIKKSSAALEAATLQLGYYLYYLKHNKGIRVRGYLLFPQERKRQVVELTSEMEAKVEQLLSRIDAIRKQPMPPEARRIPHCRPCAYSGVCWS
jgi:CRISPR-associated exonuclease Cas4